MSDTCADCGAELHKAAERAAGICVGCYNESEPDGYTTDYVTGERTPYRSEYLSGYSETPCRCGQHWGVSRVNGRCLACNASAGLWRSVAAERRVDEREHIANERAEREEFRDMLDDEFQAEQGEEIAVEVTW